MAISSSSRGLRPGVCTSTTRPVNPFDGMVIYETDTDKVAVYDVNAWVYKTGTTSPTTPALTLISTTTIGTSVSTVTVSNAFSATYENYKIILSGGVASGLGAVTMILGATTSSYYAGYNRVEYASGSSIPNNNNNTANWSAVGEATTDGLNGNIELQQPFATKRTTMQCAHGSIRSSGFGLAGGGYLNNATSYTGFTIGGPTLTGGTIRVYGYKNS
jgi:hypothetical protein